MKGNKGPDELADQGLLGLLVELLDSIKYIEE